MIKLDHVVRTYRMGKTQVAALRGLDLEIQGGEFVAVMGPSGSGKSTLLHLLGGLDLPNEGDVSLNGENLANRKENQLAEFRGKAVGFVFQTFNLIPTISALHNVELPMMFQGVPPRERTERAKHALEQVGLADRIRHKPTELSGGEQQRVAIARALVNEPKILLADEPTGNLDSDSGNQIMELFAELNVEQGITVIVVTHDPNVAAYADRVIHLLDGQVRPSPEKAGEGP